MLRRIVCITVSMLLLASAAVWSGGDQEKSKSQNLTFKKKDPKDYVGTIKDWRHSNQAEVFIKNFNKVYPNVKVELTIVSSNAGEYTQKTLNTCAGGVGAPDIFTAWSQTIGQVKDSGFWDNLSDAPYSAEELAKNLVPYTVDLARDKNGKMRGLSWQATIAGVYYRRSIAKKYLGTDDPDKIGQMLSTFEGLVKVGKTIQEKSGGTVSFMSHVQELTPMIESNRAQGWINEKNELVIDPLILKEFDMAKELWDSGITAKVKQYTPPYYGKIQTGSVFACFLPTWGLNYILMPNAPKTSGDWALTNGPMPYISGGTWAGIFSGSKNKELAWEYMKFFMFDEKHLMDYAVNYGDYVSYMPLSKKIANEVKTGPLIDFMGGQQVYQYFNKYLDKVNWKLISKYDANFRTFLDNAIESYVSGQKSKDDALKAFKADCKNAFPDLKVN